MTQQTLQVAPVLPLAVPPATLTLHQGQHEDFWTTFQGPRSQAPPHLYPPQLLRHHQQLPRQLLPRHLHPVTPPSQLLPATILKKSQLQPP